MPLSPVCYFQLKLGVEIRIRANPRSTTQALQVLSSALLLPSLQMLGILTTQRHTEDSAGTDTQGCHRGSMHTSMALANLSVPVAWAGSFEKDVYFSAVPSQKSTLSWLATITEQLLWLGGPAPACLTPAAFCQRKKKQQQQEENTTFTPMGTKGATVPEQEGPMTVCHGYFTTREVIKII
ncbi:hypothetical protein EYF80_008963 [Liparis tanakae]|uniref:Uncharacterized protein n=1 Tax=Liparis tanakae TaxID=230148 RepID=A0A4Z2IRT7_9TELE|nr:hypothetical protein EYF80_008963 [Liparis tanakae]